jgi:hypothetical protein
MREQDIAGSRRGGSVLLYRNAETESLEKKPSATRFLKSSLVDEKIESNISKPYR